MLIWPKLGVILTSRELEVPTLSLAIYQIADWPRAVRRSLISLIILIRRGRRPLANDHPKWKMAQVNWNYLYFFGFSWLTEIIGHR